MAGGLSAAQRSLAPGMREGGVLAKGARNALSSTQLKAVELLVVGELTGKQIAERLGIDASILSRWRNHDRAFMREVKQQSQLKIADGSAKIGASLSEAVDLLLTTMRDVSVDPAIRVKCAVEILDRGGLPRKAAVDITISEAEIDDSELGDLADLTAEELEERIRLRRLELAGHPIIEGECVEISGDG